MKYTIGIKANESKTILQDDVRKFADISGDYNPVHINQMRGISIFDKPIAHGMLVGSLLSNVIGMKMPGPGTLYIEQDLKFLKPVYIGDTITAYVEITEILNARKNILKLMTWIVNQDNVVVVDGFAVVKAP